MDVVDIDQPDNLRWRKIRLLGWIATMYDDWYMEPACVPPPYKRPPPPMLRASLSTA